MTSRLDRLFLLLENSGSSVTRRVAAQQLGDVVKHQPEELKSLLDRLHACIISKAWETRIAAGQAVEAIANNISLWDPAPCQKTEELEDVRKNVGRLCLTSFSITQVLKHGSYLVASDDSQFTTQEDVQEDSKENLALQRQRLNQRLGLDVAEAIGIDTQNIFSNEDLGSITSDVQTEISTESKDSVVNIVNTEMTSVGLSMSSRELNRAKRKARQYAKQKSSDLSADCSEEGPDRKKLKRRFSLLEEQCSRSSTDSNEDRCKEETEWPFASFCDVLITDLFGTEWETRHGAATALREVLKVHGCGAGMSTYQTVDQKISSHEAWLGDVAVRICCVLALDRFGDFIGDQVVAPVRETSAQVLGGVLHQMTSESVLAVLKILQEMLSWKDWETRHGGLLGLKYLLAVCDNNRSNILKDIFPSIFKGLKDEVDDVVAMAAACLVPIADDLITTLAESDVTELMSTLWDALLDIDDLTASTNSILLLLAKLLSHQPTYKVSSECLSKYVPRLWPFLYHSSVSVRKSALQTLSIVTSECSLLPHSTNNSNNHTCDNHSVITNVKTNNHNSNITCDTTQTKDVNDALPGVDADGEETSLQIDDAEEQSNNWLVIILKDLLTHIYQRALLESSPENLSLVIKIWEQVLSRVSLSSLLMVVCPVISAWMCLIMLNSKQCLDSSVLLLAHHHTSNVLKKHPGISTDCEGGEKANTKFYLGGLTSIGEVQEKEDIIVRARLTGAKLLGLLSHYVSQPMPGVQYKDVQDSLLCYIQLLANYFTARSALQRMGAGIVVREWALQWSDTVCHDSLAMTLHTCLNEIVYYDEIAVSFTRLQQDVKDFIALMKHYKLDLEDSFLSPVLTLEQIQQLCSVRAPNLLSSNKLRTKVHENLESRRKAVSACVTQTSSDQVTLTITTQAILSGATICFKVLPDNLNPVIKPLMDSIKREQNKQYQDMSAQDIALLIKLCMNRKPCPNNKIIKNLSVFLCVDNQHTPHINLQNADEKFCSIYILSKLLSTTNNKTLQRSNSKQSSMSEKTDALSAQEKDICLQKSIQRRGCTTAFRKIAQYFGDSLLADVPHLWELVMKPLDNVPQDPVTSDEESQKIINWLQLLEVLISALSKDHIDLILDKLPVLSSFLFHKYSAVRHMTARVIAELTQINTACTMSHVVASILPKLTAMQSDESRQGAVECLHYIIEKLDLDIVPYIVLLIVPLLGRNGDPNSHIRLLSTQAFASLLKLLPLEGGVPEPPNLSAFLIEQKAKERIFLDQLLNFDKAENYSIPIPIKADLRSYQQEGVNWLAFLNRYQLHGILCDDMGLGKTLQSICILAGEHYKLDLEDNESLNPLPSLVICPPTLTGHWVYEIEKFVDTKFLNPLHYTGPPIERARLRNYFPLHNLIVASYDIVRNEVDFFSKIKWNYIVLDEGHIIKNGKTKSSKAVKQLIAKHRLILTGTPIQNNVLELWSLFDFLIPGFLGSEKQFIAQYSKPILQSRDPKSTSQEQEAGVLAMEALHRQVLPFILRRVKEDVLKDLPPKITQDYYCELSLLQKYLYEDFARTRVKQNIVDSLHSKDEESSAISKPHSHIFQALQYLRRVCNHPKLVVKPQHPEFRKIMEQLKEQNNTLDDINHSAKLPALQQLLLDCGIGVNNETDSIMSPHRALVFCQLKAMLDIIENDLLKKLLPSVTYVRLDGSVPAGSRHGLVQKFNSDPSIDLFLLTTQVGGLGLNLTGADTVIFVEHDWNPMRDLQAMDRAHRIGQKKVVNVYRLITRSTLEEKIMGLQKFKMMTANTVISKENSSMFNMETDQLLDLFVLDPNKGDSGYGTSSTCTENKDKMGSQLLGFKGGVKNILENLPDLWDETQYESEYDLINFMQSLKK